MSLFVNSSYEMQKIRTILKGLSNINMVSVAQAEVLKPKLEEMFTKVKEIIDKQLPSGQYNANDSRNHKLLRDYGEIFEKIQKITRQMNELKEEEKLSSTIAKNLKK